MREGVLLMQAPHLGGNLFQFSWNCGEIGRTIATENVYFFKSMKNCSDKKYFVVSNGKGKVGKFSSMFYLTSLCFVLNGFIAKERLTKCLPPRPFF